jgi:tRNA guanosine-2'-O-methyltransferase
MTTLESCHVLSSRIDSSWPHNRYFSVLSRYTQNLLAWLRHRKQEGYYIVGLEQTSSSVSLATYRFGVNNQQNYKQQPTVLLLGKEKEGIPVEFLQAVDQCLEIPQFGIIRSLNVHVSAAIAIWEFTKQRLLTPSLAPA